MNTGHYCCGTERIYVVEEVYDAFLEKVLGGVKQLRQGETGEFDVGAVFWDKQMDIIESHVEDARAKGASVLAGGRRNPELRGLFYEPTVVTDVTHASDLMRKETFGAVLDGRRVKAEEQALGAANDADYGSSEHVAVGYALDGGRELAVTSVKLVDLLRATRNFLPHRAEVDPDAHRVVPAVMHGGTVGRRGGRATVVPDEVAADHLHMSGRDRAP